MFVLFLRSPIYTRIFTPEEYGFYSLVNITFTYLSSVSFAWVSNCAWRYYLNYKINHQISTYSLLLSFLFLCSAILNIIITFTWISLADNLLLKKLIFGGFLYFLTNELINIALIPIRIEGRARLYNLLHSIRIVLSFSLLLVLTFVGNIRIEAFFISGVVINISYIIYVSGKNLFHFNVRFTLINRSELRKFLHYGFSNLSVNLCMFILISSDRYLLAAYTDIGSVGVYNQIYNIAQIGIISLINVYQAAINPVIFETLESNAKNSNKILAEFAYRSIYLFLPIIILFALFSKSISYILLGKEFRDGYYLLPYIAIGVFLNGLNYFAMVKFKFTNRLTFMLYGAIIATVINICLNVILIPIYGMIAAAITTLISYAILWMFYYLGSNNNYLFHLKYRKKYFLLLRVILLIITIYFLTMHFIGYNNLSILPSLFLATILMITYILLTIKINPFLSNPIKKN